MSVKPEQLKVGDLIVRTNEHVGIKSPYEKTGIEALERYFKESLEGGYCHGANFEFRLFQITKIKKGIIYIAHPLTNREEDDIKYSINQILKFDKATFDKYYTSKPPKFKIGSNIINPYVNWTPEQIRNYTYPNKYNIDYTLDSTVDNNNMRCKQVPFLTVSEINIRVLFNLKIKRFLNILKYEYVCTQPSNIQDIEITFRATEELMSPYTAPTSIWNTVCTTPNQEI